MADDKGETVVQGVADNTEELELRIQSAMRARAAHIKEQSSSLTLEGVRRFLEKDLGLEEYALDAHKRVVKQSLEEFLEGSNSGNDSENEEDTGEQMKNGKRSVKEEESDSFEGYQESNDASESISKDKEGLNDDSLLGLMKERKKAKAKADLDESEEVMEKKAPTNETIAEALKKRATYLKANSEELTLAGLRRLLEEDLELEKHSLDLFKKFIADQVDELLDPKQASVPGSKVKKNVKTPQGKVANTVRSRESPDSADSESDEDDEEVKPRKKKITKRKESNETKKRKKPAKDKEVSRKRVKTKENQGEESGDENDDGNSDDGQSQSSAEKSTKKKAVATPPAYGKRVEHLKSVIKSCGMSVPPNIYKRVKQATESKRESQLIKELEDILSKEGLSSDPSEKEIKEVRKKKQRAKELEGIDMSNIVSSSRRRSTTSYVPPPKPKISVESDSEDSEDDDDEENDDDDEEKDNEKGNDDASQSEESDVDDGVSSD